VFAETLGAASTMNTTHLWILCRYAAKVHILARPRLPSSYHMPDCIHIPAAV